MTTDVPLQCRNTLQLPARVGWLLPIREERQIPGALKWAHERGLPVLVLGGGSNLVLAGDFPGLVLAMEIRERIWHPGGQGGDATSSILSLGAGENWDRVVRCACEAGYRGLENLALIPGTVGAAPVQNIGAYGAELSDVLFDVRVYDRQAEAFRTLNCAECRFGYRDSLFKQERDRFIITRVRLKLFRTSPFKLDYGELAQCFAEADHDALTPLAVAETVAAIRRQKLPDPGHLPNAGSFFKNPIVDHEVFLRLKGKEPGLIGYPDPGGYKLAAGWMIERCGWKGYRDEQVGVHARQALVLVNHANGTGADILSLAARIQADVHKRFGVRLEIEPRVVGSFPQSGEAGEGGP